MSNESEKALLWAVENPDARREEVACLYALSLHEKDLDWVAVNKAITQRWSYSGLGWIKKRAWEIDKPLRTAALLLSQMYEQESA